jgi:hypothetical protein
MNRLLLCVGSAVAALVLAACGSDDDTPAAPAASPTVTVDDATTGAYVVSVGTADALAVGKYYAAADGSRLLVLQGTDDRVAQLYRRASAGAAWIPVPAASTATTVTLATRAAVAVTSPTAAALAGKYRVAIDGGHADFTLGADGLLTAGSATCKLSGTTSAGTLPGTLKLTLATSGCGALPASATGVLVADPDFAPAVFRLVADNDKVTVDLWAYAD